MSKTDCTIKVCDVSHAFKEKGVLNKISFEIGRGLIVRNRNKRKESLCLISTDVNLDEDEIIRVYGKRWNSLMKKSTN